MARSNSRLMKLRDDHGWRCKPGNAVFVANRGAVRFDYPKSWTIQPADGGAIAFYDEPPPADDCRLQLSVIQLPPGIDMSGLPLEEMLIDAIGRPEPGHEQTPLETVHRGAVELTWTETHYIDQGEQRPARSRNALGRAGGVHCILTFDFWEDDASRLLPVWDEVLRTLRIGEYIADPTRGPRRLRR